MHTGTFLSQTQNPVEGELTMLEDSLWFQINPMCKAFIISMAIQNKSILKDHELPDPILQCVCTVSGNTISSLNTEN